MFSLKKGIISKVLIVVIIIHSLYILSLFFSSTSLSNHPEKLRVYVLDIGQGDSMLLQNEEGNYALIDSGKSTFVLSELKGSMKSQKYIDWIMITHPDSDHAEGAIAVLDYYHVNKLIVTEYFKNNVIGDELVRKAESNGVEVVALNSSNDFTWGCCTSFDVVWPLESLQVEDINDSSIGFILENGDFSMYSAGDLGKEYELKSVDGLIDLDVDVLKVGHHGSNTSTSLEFLDLIKPEVALISVGKGNSYGHPNQDVLENLSSRKIDVYRTDLEGRLTIELYEDHFNICRSINCRNFPIFDL